MSNPVGKRWPGESDEAYPEVFNNIPPQPSVLKPGQLPLDKVQQFFDQGFILIESFFKPEELDPAKASIDDLVEELAVKLHNAGRIKDLYREYGYLQRLTMIDKEFPGANIILHKIAKLPKSFSDIWSNRKLLNVAEQLLGTSDLAGTANWNLRVKVPKEDAATVPWHQDSGYLDNDTYSTFQLGAWIPLIDADESTGCLQMMRNGHKSGKVAKHVGCWRNTWYIMLEDDEIRKTLGCDPGKDAVTCPVPYGGLILFNNIIPHRSLDNITDRIRWSLDFRWQDANKPSGFYGVKDCVRMRSSTDPDFKIDWDSFNAVNRHDMTGEDAKKDEDEFDTTIPGPWMQKWELVNTNRHTEAWTSLNGNISHLNPRNFIVG